MVTGKGVEYKYYIIVVPCTVWYVIDGRTLQSFKSAV